MIWYDAVWFGKVEHSVERCCDWLQVELVSDRCEGWPQVFGMLQYEWYCVHCMVLHCMVLYDTV